jgi:general secretion pathway protein M
MTDLQRSGSGGTGGRSSPQPAGPQQAASPSPRQETARMPGATGTRSAAVQALRAWWQGRAARERVLLSVGGVVLSLGLLWALAVQPAWRTLQRAPVQLEALDGQLQHMRMLAAEAQQLRAAPRVLPDQAMAVLKAAAGRLGGKGKLSVQGDRATLTLTALEPGQLTSWLAEVRAGARVRPLEANLTRAGNGYSGTLVLGLGAEP